MGKLMIILKFFIFLVNFCCCDSLIEISFNVQISTKQKLKFRYNN